MLFLPPACTCVPSPQLPGWSTGNKDKCIPPPSIDHMPLGCTGHCRGVCLQRQGGRVAPGEVAAPGEEGVPLLGLHLVAGHVAAPGWAAGDAQPVPVGVLHG